MDNRIMMSEYTIVNFMHMYIIFQNN